MQKRTRPLFSHLDRTSSVNNPYILVTTIISGVRRDESLVTRFILYCYYANGFVSSGNLSAFDVIGSKRPRYCYHWKRRTLPVILSSKLRHQRSVAPYSTDNRSIKPKECAVLSILEIILRSLKYIVFLGRLQCPPNIFENVRNY